MLLCGTSERVFVCCNSRLGNPHFLQPTPLEAALPDVFQFVRENDALQLLAALECTVFYSPQRGRQLNALQRAVLEDAVVHFNVTIFIYPQHLESFVEHCLPEVRTLAERALVDSSHR